MSQPVDHNRFAFRRNVTALLTFSKIDTVAEGDVFQNLWLGCTIAAFANIIIAAGLNVQKYTHMKLTNQMQSTTQSSSQQRSPPPGASASAVAENAANQTNASNASLKYWRSPIWWLGIAFLILGEMGNFVAYGLAPASAIAPLGITCVIANVVVARLFLKENLRVTTLVGSFIGASGAVLLVLFIAKENDTIFDPRGVESAVTQPYFVLYLTGLAVALVVLFMLYYIQRVQSLLLILFIANILAAITVITAKAVSGFAVLFLRGSLSVVGLLSQPVLYFLVLCVILTGITQVKFVQDALAIYPATFVVPVNYILFTLSAITAGIIFYGELLGLGEVNVIIFIIGCILCFAGVFLITDDGRACVSIQQARNGHGSGTIAESTYAGATTASSATGGTTLQHQNSNNPNKVATLLRDCVKIAQSKFEMQPLLHSSPTQAQKQQQQAKEAAELMAQQTSMILEEKTMATSQMLVEPSPISKHMTATSSDMNSHLGTNDGLKTCSFATLSPTRAASNSVVKLTYYEENNDRNETLEEEDNKAEVIFSPGPQDTSLTVIDQKSPPSPSRKSPAPTETEILSPTSNMSPQDAKNHLILISETSPLDSAETGKSPVFATSPNINGTSVPNTNL